MAFIKNNEIKVGDLVVTKRKISISAGYFEKGTTVKIIGVSERGYDLEDEFGNQILETGFDSVCKSNTKSNISKKYRYNVAFLAEEEITGTIELTKKEADIVAYATNSNNWNNVDGGGFCGSFFIDINNPQATHKK